jgi:hypothetical protein
MGMRPLAFKAVVRLDWKDESSEALVIAFKVKGFS